MPADLTDRLRTAALQLDLIGDGLLACVPMAGLARDDLTPDERAAAWAALVVDAVGLELLAFARSGDPARVRDLAEHVADWLDVNVGYETA